MGKVIKLTFLGDMLCQHEQIAAVKKAKCGYDVVFDQVKHLWSMRSRITAIIMNMMLSRRLKGMMESRFAGFHMGKMI